MTALANEGFELRGEATPIRRLLIELWHFRDLVRMLSRKAFFVRYRRASFGLLWSVGLPIVQAGVLAVVFSQIVRIETAAPYPVFIFSGVLPWSIFSASIGTGVTSIVDGRNLASKVYFPRAILPLVVVGGGLYGLLPGLGVMVLMTVLFGVPVGLHTLLLVPAVVVLVVLASAFTLVLAALQVYFRDMRYIVQAALFAWFYGSAVFFPLETVPEVAAGLPLRHIFQANPATGMIQFFRAAIVDNATDFGVSIVWTLGWSVALLVLAAFLYRRYDRVFVDLL